MATDTIKVLDRGYVRLVDHMGSDLTPVNSAKVSYMKESGEVGDREIRLIRFLATHGHTSPFRHAVLQFEIKAPVVLVGRQWFKYRVGSEIGPDTAELLGVDLPQEVAAWLIGGNGDDSGFDDRLYARNEASRRYVTLGPEFYLPKADQWRGKPENSKQGSSEPVDLFTGSEATEQLRTYVMEGVKRYQWALDHGICAEQARLFLPYAGLYTVWRWTASFSGVVHFLEQRLGHDAQAEIRQYAAAVLELVRPLFPVSTSSMFTAK